MTEVQASLEFTLPKDRSRMRSREVAYAAIKHAILLGRLEPNERLVEERLSEALGISRTPIREALAILEHEGLLEPVPYKGLIVKPVTIDEFLNMYDALGVIEAALARAAAADASPAAIRRMSSVLAEAEATIPDDVPGHLAACREFQYLLGVSADRPFLAKILLSIEERSDMYLLHAKHTLPPDRMWQAVADRRAILEAVRAGDREAAARAAVAHAESIRVRWRDMYVSATG